MGDPHAALTVARGDRLGAAGIVAGALLVVAAVGVRGEFPLSDDWSYAHATRALCTTGALDLLPWTGASLVLQSGYGALLCRLFGFSFEVLRASTLVLATVGVLVFHALLGRAGVGGRMRALATALFALDPLYVNLAFTFMTDVPFTVAAVIAGYAYVRGFGGGGRGWLVGGGGAAGAALLVRQHGLFLAAAAVLAALGAPERTWRERWRDALAAGALPLAVAVGYHVWLFAFHGAPGAVTNKLDEAAHASLAGVLNCAFRGLAYLGLLLAPLALAVRHDVRARHPRRAAAACAGLAALAVFLYRREGAAMFYLPNVMYDLGLGALTLRDVLFLELPPPIAVGAPLAAVSTVAATLAAGVLATAWASGRERWRDPVARFLLVAAAVLFGATLLHTRFYFDRYLLPVLPFAIAATCVTARGRPRWGSAALTALLAYYAVAGTHDYLAWNRARDAGLAALTAAGVPARAIDGGMDWNGWRLAAELDTWPTNEEARRGQPLARRSWWWVADDRFVASFRPLPGYEVHRSVPYERWLPPSRGRIVILERVAAPPDPARATAGVDPPQ